MRSLPRIVLLSALALGAGVAGCSSALSNLVGVSVHNVFVTPGNPQPGTGGDTVYISVSNSGVNAAYLQRCGDEPALDLQVYRNGAWTEMTPPTCSTPSGPGPLELDPGTPIVTTVLYPNPGHYRVGVWVASMSDLSDLAEAWTVDFDVP